MASENLVNRALMAGQKLSRLAINPLVAPRDPEARGHAQLVAALLLALILGLLLTSIWWGNTSLHTLLRVGLALLATAYVLNHLGRHRLAALLAVGYVALAPYVGLIATSNERLGAGPEIALVFSVCSIMLAYLLFRVRTVILVALLNIAGIVLVLPTFYTFERHRLVLPLLFVAVMSIFIVIASILSRVQRDHVAAQARELAESEERYRTLFEAMFDPFIIHDRGVILDANLAFERLTGYPLADVVGRRLGDFVRAEDQDTLRRQLVSNPTDLGYRLTLIRADRSLMYVEIREKAHRYRGQPVRVFSARDITQQRQIEAQQLELSLEREKIGVLQRFIGNMSHDLRTPLTIIKTSLYLLKRLIEDPEKRQRQLDIITTQTEHLQRLLDDLLNMSKLDKSDSEEFRFHFMNVNDPIADVIIEHRQLSLRKNQTLVFKPDPHLLPILLDETQFKRMMGHLVLNAVNFTPNGGAITISTTEEENSVVIRVQDNGIGISAEDLPRIFDHFYRADSARNSDTGGTGLGLTIARKIVEAHGGDIEAQSVPNQGSTFTVRLPLVETIDTDVTEGTR